MISQEDIQIIKKLLQEYAPQTMRYELEDWVSTCLYDTYRDQDDPNCTLFKFNESVIKYLPSKGIFNIVRPLSDSITEFTLSVNMLLNTMYGTASLQCARGVLDLQESDFELMSMQITEEFYNFDSNIGLVTGALLKDML
jgi:hypothetical protein